MAVEANAMGLRRANRYPHPATPIPHFVLVRQVVAHRPRSGWAWADLTLWGCVVAWALMDIVTTAVGLHSGLAEEANVIGAQIYDAGGALAMLQVKLAVLFGILAIWAIVPMRLRPYVRGGTLAGGLLTLAAAAHNALLLL